MARAMSEDLRWRLIRLAVEEGLSTGEAAQRMCVGKSTVGSWVRLYRRTGSVTPGKKGNPGRASLDAHEAFILGLIEQRADITLAEMAARFEVAHGLRIPPSTLWYFLGKRGQTFKKDGPCGRTGPPGRLQAPREMVRAPAGPRSGAPCLHRRERRIDQDGAPARTAPHTGIGRRSPSPPGCA